MTTQRAWNSDFTYATNDEMGNKITISARSPSTATGRVQPGRRDGPMVGAPVFFHGNLHHLQIAANPRNGPPKDVDAETSSEMTAQDGQRYANDKDPKRILVSTLVNTLDSNSNSSSNRENLPEFKLPPYLLPQMSKNNNLALVQTSNFNSDEVVTANLPTTPSHSAPVPGQMLKSTPSIQDHSAKASISTEQADPKLLGEAVDHIDESSQLAQWTEPMRTSPSQSMDCNKSNQGSFFTVGHDLESFPSRAGNSNGVENPKAKFHDRGIPSSPHIVEARSTTKSSDLKLDASSILLNFTCIDTMLENQLLDCYTAHAIYVKEMLKKARMSKNEGFEQYSNSSFPVSPFAGLGPLQFNASKTAVATENEEKVEQSRFFGGPKSKMGASLYQIVPVTWYECIAPAVPTYASYIPVQESILGENEVRLFSWPWFEDGYVETKDLHEEIKQNYEMLIDDRLDDLLEKEKSKHVKKYVVKFLKRVGCAVNDVLRYLLDPDDNLTMENSEDVLKALSNRSIHNGDISRRMNKWKSIMNDLGSSTSRTIAVACLACEVFRKRQGFNLWHVVKLAIAFDEYSETIKESQLAYSSAACAICQMHDCPIHGGFEVKGNDSDYEFDSDSPEDMNYKKNIVAYKQAQSMVKQPLTKRGFEHWQRTVPEASHIPKRAPFYPCHHEGSCTSENCSCVRNKVTCEKTCACPANCNRRYQGCTCSKSGKTCWQNKRCDCFLLNRECDPDLCESCGAAELLDPANQGIPDIALGRCMNVAMQRNISKRTLAGNSDVAGFGLFMGEPTKRHEFIGEYKGEVIAKEEGDRRGTIYARKPMEYLFNLDQEQEVDSTNFGNKTRFINHPSEPGEENCYPRPTLCNTVIRIGLFASRDIAIGEELFFDYGGDFWKSKGIRKQGGTQLVPVRIRKPTTTKSKSKSNNRRRRNGIVSSGSKSQGGFNSKVVGDQELKANVNAEAEEGELQGVMEDKDVGDVVAVESIVASASASESDTSLDADLGQPTPWPATDSEDESYRSSRRASSSERSSAGQRRPRRSQRKRRRSS